MRNHNVDSHEKKVLITGISKGIGKAIANILSINSYKVIGTCQAPDKIKNRIPGIKYIQLDLNDKSSIVKCIEAAGDIDILINNAGICQFGPAEEIPVDKYKQLFEVNLFGLILLTQSFIPAMRKKRHGFIINIGSLADQFPVPFQSGYTASKYALLGFSWTLKMELLKYGIKVVLFEPNDINTSMKPEVFVKNNSEYKELANIALDTQLKNMLKAPGPEIVAKKVLQVLNKNNPKAFYTIDKKGSFVVFLKRFLSIKQIEKIVKSAYKLNTK